MQIHFERLLKNYNSELVIKLRGFNKQHDYLQYWVPGTSKIKSLLNLIDALYEIDKLNFSILILKTDKLLIAELKDISKKIGNIKIEKREKNFNIIFSLDKLKYQIYKENKTNIKNIKFTKKINHSIVQELIGEREKYSILTDYEKDIDKYKFRNNESQNINNEDLFSEFINNKNKLFIKIDKKTNLIINCWHDFMQQNQESIITDKFCDIILNKHIQEVTEHGMIYLEHKIRPIDIKGKIRGIILPKKVGGIFFDLDKCIRKIYTKIKKQYGFQDVINKEYFNLSKDWLNLHYDQKIEKLKQTLYEKIIPSLKLDKNDIIIYKIEFDSRIIIKISEEFEKKNRGEINYMIMVENFFKNYIDKRLELFVREKKDDNRLRQLNSLPKN